MPRDYYEDRRESGGVSRDRYPTKQSEKDKTYKHTESSGRAYCDPEYDARNYTTHDRPRETVMSDRDRSSSKQNRDYYDSRAGKEFYASEFSSDYDEKRNKHKKSKHKKRTRESDRDDKKKSLVTAYDDISSDSDIPISPSGSASHRGSKDFSRAKSPSTAIKEYQRIKERSHSNSPAVREKSPSRNSSSRKSKSSRLTSPEAMHSKRDSSRDNKYKNRSPSHSPSPKKPRYRSRSPSPHR